MMIRLFLIEWLKLKHYKVFWILLIMYLSGLIVVCSGVGFFLEFLKSRGAEFEGIDPTVIPFYDFPDVWHNLSYLATYFKIILGFIVIISITNEFGYKTLRQNVIDGLNKKEFLISKLIFNVILGVLAVVVLFLTGITTGLIYSVVTDGKYIFSSLDFLGGYFIEVLTFLTFATLAGLLLKKAGFAIVSVFMYTLVFEPVLTLNFEHNPHIPEIIAATADFWPIRAINNLIPLPFQRYIFMEVQDYVAFGDLAVVLAWLGIFISLSYLVLLKKDL